MRSIFGRIQINQKSIDPILFHKSMDTLSVTTSVLKEIHIENNTAFGQVNFSQQHTEVNQLPDSNLVLISDSTIYNKKDLTKDLEISNDLISDDLIILKAYEKWNIKCLNYLVGDFAFAIWNNDTEELFCARDHFGVKPFHYYYDNDTFIFSSDIAAISAQSDLKLNIDLQQIADSLSIIKSEKHRTSYKEIKRLPPASYLILNKKELKIKSYWELKPQIQSNKRDVEIVEEFKNLLIESVKCRIKNKEHVGAELSGGIDSSTVTAIASGFSNIKTFSHILPDHVLGKIHPFKDEREFINLLADYCKISSRYFIKSETSLLKSIQQHISDYNAISQQNFGIFSDVLYTKAKQENISVLVSGFGGDEMVTSKASGYLNELARNKVWEEVKKDLKNQFPSKIKYLKAFLKLKLKSQYPRIYLFLITFKFQKPWWLNKFQNLALNPNYEKESGIKTRYFEYYNNTQTKSLQEKTIDKITHPHVSQRLEYCSIIARKYGIEYRYPLLDKRLIEFYLSVPTRLKARNGIGRYIIRRSIEGIVPEKIQWRNDKSGATIPTVLMRMMRDQDKILEIINNAKLNEQITKFINLDKYEKWFYKLIERSEKPSKFINPGAFYNYLKLILFIENNPKLFHD